MMFLVSATLDITALSHNLSRGGTILPVAVSTVVESVAVPHSTCMDKVFLVILPISPLSISLVYTSLHQEGQTCHIHSFSKPN